MIVNYVTIDSHFSQLRNKWYLAFYVAAGLGESNDRPKSRTAKIQVSVQCKNWTSQKTWKPSGKWGGFSNQF